MRRAISTERRLSKAITRTPLNPRVCVTRLGIVFQRFRLGESIALRISGVWELEERATDNLICPEGVVEISRRLDSVDQQLFGRNITNQPRIGRGQLVENTAMVPCFVLPAFGFRRAVGGCS